MNDNIYVIEVGMDNESADEIAKEAALKIIRITDQLIVMQEAEKGKKSE